MSGVSFDPSSFSARLNEIQAAVTQPDKKLRVNANLEIVNKENGFVRFLKIVFLPLARMFGQDPFTHYRANKVALEIFNQYQKLSSSLDERDVRKIREILSQLNVKTNKRYDDVISVLLQALPGSTSGTAGTSAPSTGTTPPPPPPPPPGPGLIPPPPPGQPATSKGSNDGKAGPGAAAVFAQINQGGFQLKKVKKEEDATAAPSGKPTGSPETGKGGSSKDAKTPPLSAKSAPGALASELAALLSGGKPPLKKGTPKPPPVAKPPEDTGEAEEVDPFAIFGAKKNKAAD